jgi:CubicO group peptidase (beta-lactamase class C family)
MAYIFKFNCLKVSTVALFLLFYQCAQGQQFTELDAFVSSREKALGGDVITMVGNKDTIIAQKATKLFTPRTAVPIGQMSQWLTAVVVLSLVEEGKLSLDDKVSAYLPVFEKYGKNFITIRHCLTHFTGIEAGGKGGLFSRKSASLEEEAASYAAREIKTNPGTEFQYSSVGPAIAARVAEVVSKKRFDALAQQKVFRPLGMRQTSFSTLDGSAVNAFSGARSTAADLMVFLRMLLNNGVRNGQQVVSPAIVKELRTLATPGAKLKPVDIPEGTGFVAGAWAPEAKSGEASTLLGPGFGNVLALVDFCRGSAFVLLVKDPKDESVATTYPSIRLLLQKSFPKVVCN